MARCFFRAERKDAQSGEAGGFRERFYMLIYRMDPFHELTANHSIPRSIFTVHHDGESRGSMNCGKYETRMRNKDIHKKQSTIL